MITLEMVRNALYHADIMYDKIEQIDKDTIRAVGWRYLHFDQLQTIAANNYFKGVRVINGELALEFMTN